MSDASEYRRRAAKYREQTKLVRHPELARELAELATICIQLAQLTEQGVISDLVYEPEPPKLMH